MTTTLQNGSRIFLPADVNVTITRTTYTRLEAGILDGSISVADTINSSFDMDGGKFDFLLIAEEPVHLACSREMGRSLPSRISREELMDILRENKLLLGSSDAFGEASDFPIDIFREAFGPMDFEPKIQVCSSPLAIPSQVASGLGVSLCNRSNLFAIDPNTSIIEIEAAEKKHGTSYAKGLISARENRSPLVERFLEIVREKLK